ncbi:MAG: hypothetical protein KC912_01015 [Proteobacteria bacterium]|nr:hypothetical protein [Pseudomonadota bacterium]
MRRLTILLALCGCSKPEPLDGMLDEGVFNPFPSMAHMDAGAVSLPASAVPTAVDGTVLPVERLSYRTGFSPGQTSVIWLDAVDASTLPSWRAPTPGEGGVQLYDRTDERFLPVFAELDAHETAAERPGLLIRPLEALKDGHDIAVVVHTSAAERPAAFDLLLERPHDEDLALSEAAHATLADLESAGLSSDDVAVAWSFPVGRAVAPLSTALDQVELDGEYSLDLIREFDAGDRVGPFTLRNAEGSFRVQDFLVDDLVLDLQDDGSVPASTAVTDASLWVHVPMSVRDADAGSVPVMIFGHGIFGEPANYLGTSDTSAVLQLADELGVIAVGTTWRGLEADDRLEALEVAGDFGRIPQITDRLVQGHVNQRTLVELVRNGTLMDDAFFEGDSGQKLADTSTLVYYGISLGGIEGQVFMAQDPPVEAAVLHVPGGIWSTMLERSTQWPLFEILLDDAIESPHERQLLYAISQLFWDPVDPVSWTEELSTKTFLLQESIGDEQVPNMTTEALARSMELPILSPVVRLPYGLEESADLPAGSSALVQFDTLNGEPLDINRPPSPLGNHAEARLLEGARLQAIEFLTPGQFGTVTHFCGSDPCTPENDASSR